MAQARPFHVEQVGVGAMLRMRDLNSLFSRAFEDAESYERRPPSDAYLATLLQRDLFIALVALQDGAVIGGLTAYELPKFEQERSEIYIYDLAVDAAHRRRGVATALIEELRRIGAARGAWVIYVQADTGEEDQPAIELYSKLGSREEVLHFDIAVRASEPKST